MASKVVRVIQDQNLNVPSDAGASKSTKKGIMKSSRRPLGDLSNRGKPEMVGKGSRKPDLTNFPTIIADASNKKGSTKASGKVQARSKRKALTDVSNYTAKPLQKTSTVVAEESCCDYEKEGFVHDHEQCIKAMRKGSQMDELDVLRMINGPTPSKKISSPPRVEQDCLITYTLKEIPEEDQYTFPPVKQVSSPPFSPLPSPHRYTNLLPIDDCDFQLIASP